MVETTARIIQKKRICDATAAEASNEKKKHKKTATTTAAAAFNEQQTEEESTMKTRAMKSLCKQAQNECRVVIAGALLILPKDLVLIVRFAGLFFCIVVASLSA